MSDYLWSSKDNAFIPAGMTDVYESSGWDISKFVPVDSAVFDEFAGTPPDGKIRIASSDGMPAWGDVPPPTQEEITAQAEQKKSQLRAVADAEINWRQDAADAEMATEEESSALAQWKKYRVQLMRVNTAEGAAVEWPNLPE